MDITANVGTGVFLTSIILVMAVGTLLSTGEWLVNAASLTDEGVLGWSFLRTRRGIWSRAWMVRLAAPVLGWPGFLVLLIVRGLAAVCLVAMPTHDVIRPVMLSVLLFCALGINIRSFPYGTTGADRMRLVVLGALWLRELVPGSPLATQACLWFIALQCCLSYVTPGLTKLRSARWRSGEALRTVFRHGLLGHRGMSLIAERHPALFRPLTWSVILLQVTFPLALLDPRICVVYLVGVFSFHLGTAALMGLNHFVWSWAATYPAVLYVAISLR